MNQNTYHHQNLKSKLIEKGIEIVNERGIWQMNKDRKNIILGNKISEIYDWNLGGYKQKVLI